MTSWKSRVTVVRDDITDEDVDVIVNAANEDLARGGGVCGAIHAAAGPGLERECREIGYCPTGEAVATGAYELRAKAVVHTVGPIWGGGAGDEEDELLASCYRECIALAADLDYSTISFPSISTGTYGFPVDRAAEVAVAAIREALEEYPDIREVRLVCFSAGDLAVYEAALESAEEDDG
ncbi:MAG: O-acetyl-ADP-ribose deacetylase [Candidatus Krumholzibacteriia bacterium]